jgi:hypothetical protein
MNYEAPGYQERFPEWRSSDGALREKKDRGDKPLPGYAPSEKERRRGDEPKKIYELKNSYTTLAVGINKKKELVTVGSQQRTKALKALPQTSKRLEGETSKKVPLLTGNVQVNEPRYRQEESAFGYRERSSRGAPFAMNKLEKIRAREDLRLARTAAPFLGKDKEKEELRVLREQARALAESGDREERQGIEKRVQFLTVVRDDKERNWKRMYAALPELITRARKGVRTEMRWVGTVNPAAAVAADGEDGAGSGDDANRGKAGKPEAAGKAGKAGKSEEVSNSGERRTRGVKADGAKSRAARAAARELKGPSGPE